MKTLKTIFIALTLLLTLGNAHAHQNRRGYQTSRRQAKPRREFDPLMTYLHHDSLHGDYEKVKSLLQTECFRKEINDKNSTGKTPLHLAAMKGHLEIIKLLIEHGADVNAQANGGSTALNMVTTQKHKNIIEIIKYLFLNGADITLTYTIPATKDKPEIKNLTPLHTALLKNQPLEIIQTLVEFAQWQLNKEEFKTFIDAQANDGQTALSIAVTQKQKETILYLLEKNADITLTHTMPATKDKLELKNVTPLHAALLSNQPFEIIQTLVEYAKQHLNKEEFKAFTNTQTNYGDTALHFAVNQGQKETIKYLLENGANPNIQTAGKIKQDKIRSPFQILIRLHEQSPIKYKIQDATRYSSKELCELIPLFLEHGARIDLVNKSNQTPLYWLIRTQLINELKVLIENSTQKNNLYEALKVKQTEKTDEFGKTIWDTIKLFYNPEIIDILVNTKNKEGKTFIDIAQERNDQEVLIKLFSYQQALKTYILKTHFLFEDDYDYPLPELTIIDFFQLVEGIAYTLENHDQKETYQFYKHNKLELRYHIFTLKLQYRHNTSKQCIMEKAACKTNRSLCLTSDILTKENFITGIKTTNSNLDKAETTIFLSCI